MSLKTAQNKKKRGTYCEHNLYCLSIGQIG
jgi:hypothetical protein